MGYAARWWADRARVMAFVMASIPHFAKKRFQVQQK